VDKDQLRTLDELCSSSYSSDDAASVDRFLAANTSFHTMIGRAGGNERLTGMLEIMLVQMERLFRIGLLLSSRAEEIVHEHRDLVEAIMSGDGRLARQVAVAQIHASQRMVLEAFISSSEVTTTPIGMPSLNEARNGDI
jgi:DNA-binding GntR family transcriptional regulator